MARHSNVIPFKQTKKSKIRTAIVWLNLILIVALYAIVFYKR